MHLSKYFCNFTTLNILLCPIKVFDIALSEIRLNMHLDVNTEEILNSSSGSGFWELFACFPVQPKQLKPLCFLATIPFWSFLICKQQATGNKAAILFSCCSLPHHSYWLLLSRPLLILVLKEREFWEAWAQPDPEVELPWNSCINLCSVQFSGFQGDLPSPSSWWAHLSQAVHN